MPPFDDKTADPLECRRKAAECMELSRRAADRQTSQRFWHCMEMWLEIATRLERLEQDWHDAPAKAPPARATTDARLRLGLKQAERHVELKKDHRQTNAPYCRPRGSRVRRTRGLGIA